MRSSSSSSPGSEKSSSASVSFSMSSSSALTSSSLGFCSLAGSSFAWLFTRLLGSSVRSNSDTGCRTPSTDTALRRPRSTQDKLRYLPSQKCFFGGHCYPPDNCARIYFQFPLFIQFAMERESQILILFHNFKGNVNSTSSCTFYPV